MLKTNNKDRSKGNAWRRHYEGGDDYTNGGQIVIRTLLTLAEVFRVITYGSVYIPGGQGVSIYET